MPLGPSILQEVYAVLQLDNNQSCRGLGLDQNLLHSKNANDHKNILSKLRPDATLHCLGVGHQNCNNFFTGIITAQWSITH